MRLWILRLIGVLLVLAFGVALGAGPLQKSSARRDDDLATQKQQVAAKQRTIDSLQAAGEYSAAYATATSSGLVNGALTGRSVTLITLPGADSQTVAGLRMLITAAGGEVTADVSFAAVMGKSSSRQLVEALTSQMATQNPSVEMAADAGGYQRFGTLLARAVGLSSKANKKTATYDTTSVGIISGLETAALVTTSDISVRAALTLVVTGPAAASADAAGENAVPVTILQSYADRAPVVVAGPASAAGELGILGALRAAGAHQDLSTVDTAEAVSGQVTAVLALSALTRGTTGAWGGIQAKDGIVPPLS